MVLPALSERRSQLIVDDNILHVLQSRMLTHLLLKRQHVLIHRTWTRDRGTVRVQSTRRTDNEDITMTKKTVLIYSDISLTSVSQTSISFSFYCSLITRRRCLLEMEQTNVLLVADEVSGNKNINLIPSFIT